MIRQLTLGMFCLFLVSQANAQLKIPHLLGPNAKTLPYIHVQFISSTFRVTQGTKSANGECVFPVDATIKRSQLPERMRFVQVSREIDYERCEELIEEGIALKDSSRTSSASDVEASEYGYSAGLTSFKVEGTPSAAADQPTSVAAGRARIKWTDGRHPLISMLRNLVPFDGILVSEVIMRGEATGFCNSDGEYKEVFIHQLGAWNVATQWKGELGTLSTAVACGSGVGTYYATHSNSLKLEPAQIDCANTVYVNYAPMRFTIFWDNYLSLAGTSAYVAGDLNKCGEYLVRFVELELV